MARATPLVTPEDDGNVAVPCAALDAVLQRLTRRLAALLGLRAVAIVLGPLSDHTPEPQVWGSDLANSARHAMVAAWRAGPAAETLASGRPVGSANLLLEHRWPSYRQLALDAGYEAVCALPIVLGTQPVAAIVLASQVSHPWSHDELAKVEVLLEPLAGYLLAIDELRRAQRTCTQLQQALDSRITIEQAKGVLAERLGTNPTHAFDVLREQARSSRRPLRELADELLDSLARQATHPTFD